jgi:homoserine kinase
VNHRLEAGASVIIEVPATSANLGPGFDCFGLAFSWRERLELAVIERGFQLEVTGEGADNIPRDESHLIMRSVLTGLTDLGYDVPGLRLRCRNTIPHGRGLGSSSAAIVAGLTAAAALAGRDLDRHWLLGHAQAIEGHPDNVAAAIWGGFVLAYTGRNGVTAASSPVDPEVEAAVFVAEASVGTHAARGLLPQQVPHADAAANAGRAALLVHALAHEPALLFDATQDWLHQGYRATAMPRSYALVTALRSEGLAAVISGAGPSVVVLGTESELAGLDAHQSRHFQLRRVGIGSGVTAE